MPPATAAVVNAVRHAQGEPARSSLTTTYKVSIDDENVLHYWLRKRILFCSTLIVCALIYLDLHSPSWFSGWFGRLPTGVQGFLIAIEFGAAFTALHFFREAYTNQSSGEWEKLVEEGQDETCSSCEASIGWDASQGVDEWQTSVIDARSKPSMLEGPAPPVATKPPWPSTQQPCVALERATTGLALPTPVEMMRGATVMYDRAKPCSCASTCDCVSTPQRTARADAHMPSHPVPPATRLLLGLANVTPESLDERANELRCRIEALETALKDLQSAGSECVHSRVLGDVDGLPAPRRLPAPAAVAPTAIDTVESGEVLATQAFVELESSRALLLQYIEARRQQPNYLGVGPAA